VTRPQAVRPSARRKRNSRRQLAVSPDASRSNAPLQSAALAWLNRAGEARSEQVPLAGGARELGPRLVAAHQRAVHRHHRHRDRRADECVVDEAELERVECGRGPRARVAETATPRPGNRAGREAARHAPYPVMARLAAYIRAVGLGEQRVGVAVRLAERGRRRLP